MKNKNLLNEKKLSKDRVQEIIGEQGNLRIDLMEAFAHKSPEGIIFEQNLVYELKDGNFLVVRDPKIKRGGGTGDIWKREYTLRFSSWSKKVASDYLNGRGSSVEHWFFYSKNKSKLIENVPQLIEELSHQLKIVVTRLDKTYVSLDLVSERVEELGWEKSLYDLYDNLVAYVGE